MGRWIYSTGLTVNRDCGSFSVNTGDRSEGFLEMVLCLKSATAPLLAHSFLSSSSSPWLTPVTTSTLAWIPTTPATPSPTAASASPSTETGKSTTCTWGRRVSPVCFGFFSHCHMTICLSVLAPHLPPPPGVLFSGINTLINIMSRLGQDDPSPSR